MAELTGQVALVTGGSRGIGKSICERLAADGARVAVVARDAARASDVAKQLPGDGHKGYACDVADSAAVDALVKQVEADFGSLDILVNNAGVTADNRSEEHTSELQSQSNLVCRLLLEKKKKKTKNTNTI